MKFDGTDREYSSPTFLYYPSICSGLFTHLSITLYSQLCIHIDSQETSQLAKSLN